MADDDLDIHRREPPETETEWQRLHRAAYRADQTWLISRPIVAVVTNWRALAIIAAVLVWVNKPEIVGAIQVLLGKGP